MVWACDAKGRDPHNKKHVEYDGDGNMTQRTSKDDISRGDWWVVIYTACKSLAMWWGMFLGTSHFDLEGWQKNPPLYFFRERIPPWNYK